MGLSELDVFGGTFYSGSLENIKRILSMIRISEGKLSSITETEVARYQKEVDRLINRRLSPYYAVPLVKDSSGLWPEPIPFIAARLVASDIVHNTFTEIDANQSKAAETFKKNALDELDLLTIGLLAGSQKLRGQRMRSRVHFVRPGITPLEPPQSSGSTRM